MGKGTVLLEDFEKCDLVICIGHNPGTNHPRMLTSLRALVKRGAKMIAINPLQERGLERFTAPQNPFEMLTNSETQLASATTTCALVAIWRCSRDDAPVN